MGQTIHVPPSALLLIKRIAHYRDLESQTACDTQKLCYDLVATELELLLEELTETSS